MQELAIEDFSKVLNIFPDHINAAFARAACYNAVGQFSRAIEDYNFALLRDQEENRNDRSDRRRSNSHGASGSPTYHEVGGPIETRSSTDSPNPLSYNPSELGYSSDHRMEGSRHLSPTPAGENTTHCRNHAMNCCTVCAIYWYINMHTRYTVHNNNFQFSTSRKESRQGSGQRRCSVVVRPPPEVRRHAAQPKQWRSF